MYVGLLIGMSTTMWPLSWNETHLHRSWYMMHDKMCPLLPGILDMDSHRESLINVKIPGPWIPLNIINDSLNIWKQRIGRPRELSSVHTRTITLHNDHHALSLLSVAGHLRLDTLQLPSLVFSKSFFLFENWDESLFVGMELNFFVPLLCDAIIALTRSSEHTLDVCRRFLEGLSIFAEWDVPNKKGTQHHIKV